MANREGRGRARRLIKELRRARAEIERLVGHVRETSERAEDGQVGLEAQREQLHREAGQIEAEKASLEQERVEWSQQRDDQEKMLAEREAELTTQGNELDQQRQQIEARRAVLEEHQRHSDQREAELDEDRRGIEACRAELEVRQTEFEQKQQQWNQECRDREEAWRSEHEPMASQQTSEAAQALDAERDELQAQRVAFEQEKQQWEAEVRAHRQKWEQRQEESEQQRERLAAKYGEVEGRLAEWQHELDTREAELEQEGRMPEEQPTWPAGRPAATPAEPVRTGQPVETARRRAPADGASVRPRAALPLPVSKSETLPGAPQEADEDGDKDVRTGPAGGASVALSETTGPLRSGATSEEEGSGGEDGASRAHGDDESIDEYMSRLMERLNSMTSAGPADDSKVRASEPPAISRQAFLGADHPYRQKAEDAQDAGKEEEKAKRVAARHRRSALEGITSLAAMRELATATATSAISTHARGQLRKTIRGKLFLSVASLLVGTSLIVGWLVWGFQSWQFYVGVAGLFLALLWVIQYAVLIGRLTLSGSGHLSWRREGSKTDEEQASETEDNAPKAEQRASAAADDAPPAPEDNAVATSPEGGKATTGESDGE